MVIEICMIAALVVVIDAISNIVLARLLLQQSKILSQACATLDATIATVSALASVVAEIRKDNHHYAERTGNPE